MKLSTIQASMARNALTALEDDDTFAHPMITIIRIIGEHGASAVREREAEYRDFNKDVAGDTACLSPDAAAYWADWQKMYRNGRRFHAAGSGTTFPKWEMAVSRKCEALEESFAARVPDIEKGKFRVYDPQSLDADNWDDRWHACVDWFPPVLRHEFLGGAQVANPRGKAQHEVLAALLAGQPSAPQEPSVKPGAGALRALVRRLDQ